MGGEQSKSQSEQPNVSVSTLALANQIHQEYGVEVSGTALQALTERKITNKRQFIKHHKAMNDKGFSFYEIYREGPYEIGVWTRGERREKRGWKF